MNGDTNCQSIQDLDESECWLAVLGRDPKANGAFFYGVRSTRISCRPTCPSRLPNRKRVVFFATHQAAEAAGFRAVSGERSLPLI